MSDAPTAIPVEPSPDNQSNGPLIGGWMWAALLLLLPLYLLSNYGYYQDNIAYANDVEFRGWQQKIHPHHIGYSAFIWLIWKPLNALGSEIRALEVMHWLSRISALGSILLTGIVLRRHGFSPLWSAVGMLLFGTAFTAWVYGTTGAVYLPTLFCLLMIYLQLLDWAEGKLTPQSMWMITGWFLVALSFHQLAALIMIPIVAMAAICAPVDHKRTAVTQSVLLPGGISLLIYIIAWLIGSADDQTQGFAHWVTAYGHDARYWVWERVPHGQTLMQHWWQLLVESQSRVNWAMPHKLWAFPFGEIFEPLTSNERIQALQAMLPGARYKQIIPSLQLLILAGILFGSTLVLEGTDERRRKLFLAALWVLPLTLFSAIFMPSNAFYRLYYFAPVLPLLFMPIREIKAGWVQPAFGVGLALFLGFTCFTNWIYGWEPRQHPMLNPWLRNILADELVMPVQYEQLLQAGSISEKNRDMQPVVVYKGHHGDWREFQYAQQFREQPIYRSDLYSLVEYVNSEYGNVPILQRLEKSKKLMTERYYLPQPVALNTVSTRLEKDEPHWWSSMLPPSYEPDYVLRIWGSQGIFGEPEEFWIGKGQLLAFENLQANNEAFTVGVIPVSSSRD